MQYCKLGTTGLIVSRLGLGTVKFARNTQVKYPNNFLLPSTKEISALLNLAMELGINTLDTAPSYGNSEELLGELLQGNRENWVIISKAGEEFDGISSSYDFSAKHLELSIERSLKRLKTDYIDLMLLHSNGEDEKIILQDKALATLKRYQEKGYLKAIGISSKTLTGALTAMDEADVLMLTHNLQYKEELPAITKAMELNKGVIIKKALGSGHLGIESLDYVLKTPGVHSAIVGTLNPEHLKANCRLLGRLPENY